jgi:hypothetical protein
VQRCEGAHPLRAARRGPPPRPLRGLPDRITRAHPGVPEKEGPLATGCIEDGVGEGRTAGDRARQVLEK